MVEEAKKNTFTKSIMSVIVLLYFIGAMVGTGLIILSAMINIKHNLPMLDTAMFIAYAAYIGGPTAIAIGFYAWKSKAENVLKIGKTFKIEETDKSIEVMDMLSRMGGN